MHPDATTPRVIPMNNRLFLGCPNGLSARGLGLQVDPDNSGTAPALLSYLRCIILDFLVVILLVSIL